MPPSADASMPEVRVLATAKEVAAAAADEIAKVLAEAIRGRGEAHWSTTGGSAAPPIYWQLGAPPLRDTLDWGRVHVWWGDDRFVPVDHPESNVLPLEQILLASGGDDSDIGATTSDVGQAGDGVRMPADHLHPIPISAAIAHGTGPAGAAERYAAEIAARVPADDAGVPVFDLIILGVGPDGHVLSVFPGSDVWDEPGMCVAVPAPTHVEPHLQRVTMHPRVLGAARRILVISTGASKAANLGRAWTGDDLRELPVRATRLPTATWILDVAAAADLPAD